uniref:F-box domain-containing protein n=1 Tax=Caenorhabditis tropicalis TaxID=1561998 RepID=A0A1I7UE54_9PELO
MATAYHWISSHPEENLPGLAVYMKEGYLIIELSNLVKIYYYEVSSGDQVITRVKYGRKDTEVNGNLIQVVCEDIKEFLMNRKATLNYLSVETSYKIGDTISECMESALSDRSEKLRVKRIEVFNLDILKLIDPEELTSICLRSPDIDETVLFLRDWNQGCRLEVEFQMNTISKENMESIKKWLGYSSNFNRIKIQFQGESEWSQEQMISFFKPFKFSIWRVYPPIIGFNLKDPSEDVDEKSSHTPMKVFANPLLMEMILERIEWFDIQRLRKVSRDIRSCIDTLKPDPHISRYVIQPWIERDPDFPDTWDVIIYLWNGTKKLIRYRSRKFLQKENDWHVNGFVYCEDQLIERVVNDFKINIEHQNSKMYCLDLKIDRRILEMIGNVLKSRNSPLKVRWLRMRVINEKDIMNILPYLNSVDRIKIEFDSLLYLDLIDISKLNQWKNAVEVNMYNCVIINSIQVINIIHLRKLSITMNNISTNDIIYLKENLLKSANFNKFNIRSFNPTIDDSLYTSLLPYRTDQQNRKYFYLSLPISNRILQIRFCERGKYLYFECVDSIPENFFI